MKRTFAALVLALLTTLPGQAARDPTVTADQAQEFQLGFALQAPAAQTEAFLQSVKSLKEIENETDSARAVAKLASQAKALRTSEAHAYSQVMQMLHEMGAPPRLQAWAANAAAEFTAPLILSKESKDALPSDPNTAAVLGTIDEAQSVKTEADTQMPSLLNWLKLARGRTGVWTAAIGNLASGLDATVVLGTSLLMSPSKPMTLSDAAPFGTSSAVLRALSALEPQRGNLATLIHLPPVLWNPRELAAPRDALLHAYGAESFAAAIDQRQKP